ncbi:MAG TPA: hypothetical protein VJ735_05925 [Actinomycetes bacterium]|nr:hypothetical protein [Actinomycetes bacterium]
MNPEPSVGDALETTARALEAVADVLRRLAEREELEQAKTRLPKGDLNLTAAGQELGCSANHVKKLVLAGQLPGSYRDGVLWRVPPAALETYRRRKAKQTSGGKAARVAAAS